MPPPASHGFSTPTSTAASDRPSSRVPPTGAGLPTIRVFFNQGRPPPPGRRTSRTMNLGRPNLSSPADRAACDPRCPGRRGDPAVAGRFGLCRREQAAGSFVQATLDRREPSANHRCVDHLARTCALPRPQAPVDCHWALAAAALARPALPMAAIEDFHGALHRLQIADVHCLHVDDLAWPVVLIVRQAI